jgi:hypothetical protein
MEGGKFLIFGIILAQLALYVGLPLAGLYWLFTKTAIGKNLARRSEPLPGNTVSLEVADKLRGLQAQLDDAHSRLDFAERVMLEQREQLRGRGAPEPHAKLYEPTPV